MLTIGLTGGIGSGKTTVSKILAELGAPIPDADKVAHSTYAPRGPAHDKVADAFGRGIVAADGAGDADGKAEDHRQDGELEGPAEPVEEQVPAAEDRSEMKDVVHRPVASFPG